FADLNDDANLADMAGGLIAPARSVLGVAAILCGLVMLGWMVVMIAQYIAHPLPLSAVMPPRP
ncbi:MAG: hypothetical protein B7Z20_05120, partial [Sphingobium sp. 32-64-5]